MAKVLVEDFSADKVNIATLGNVVPQLHVHHVARYHDDPAWPAPVWGKHPAVAYSESALAEVKEKLLVAIAGHCGFTSAK